jgi:hypothetical protein
MDAILALSTPHITHTHTHNPKQGKMQAILALQEREHAVQAGASTALPYCCMNSILKNSMNFIYVIASI